MKHLLYAAILLAVLFTTNLSHAKGRDKTLLNDLNLALKSTDKASVKITETYKQVSFAFGNKTVHAYYDADSDEFLGFCIPVSGAELPEGSIQNVQERYKNWNMSCAIMYVNAKGDISYYAALGSKQGRLMAVCIETNGKAHFFAQMPFANAAAQ